MEQTHIYHYLGLENDPIFREITKLKSGQAAIVGNIKIKLNSHGLYEIETSASHECFSSQKQVYDGISKMLSLVVL